MSNKMERFTQRARRVLSLAQEEAERMQHSHIGTGFRHWRQYFLLHFSKCRRPPPAAISESGTDHDTLGNPATASGRTRPGGSSQLPGLERAKSLV